MSAYVPTELYRSSGQFDPCSVKRRPHPVAQGGLGLPSELVTRSSDVEARALDLAQAGRGELRFEVVAAALLLQDRDQVEHAGLPAGPDVDRAADVAPVRCGEVRRDDVADEHVVARLAAVAVDRRAPAVHQPAAEDGDDAGLAERVLAGPVDVAVAQRHGAEAVQACVGAAV